MKSKPRTNRIAEPVPPRLWPWPPRSAEADAFTLIECLAVIAALGLLTCVALPVLAGTKSDSQRILCVNNLRQIGQACAGWRNEHGDMMPVQLPASEGGLNTLQKQDAWRHFAALSNHLASPRPLVCPADPQTKTAAEWTQSPRGIIQPGGMGDGALSYTIGLHTTPDSPMEWVASDRYLETIPSQICGLLNFIARKVVVQGTNQSPDTRTGWFRSGGHEGTGNLLLNDGQVLQTTTEGLQAYLAKPVHARVDQHILQPRGK